MMSSATERSISATVRRSVFSALYAGITTQTRSPEITPSPRGRAAPKPRRREPHAEPVIVAERLLVGHHNQQEGRAGGGDGLGDRDPPAQGGREQHHAEKGNQ